MSATPRPPRAEPAPRLVAVLLMASLGAGCRRDGAPAAPASAPLATDSKPVPEADLGARGRRIYQAGEGPSGQPITAVIAGGAEVPATLVACANCHGRDGRGVREGGLIPSDLTRATLTKPYDYVRPDGRRRPPYTDALLTRAIALGIDSGGAPLDPAMPRYRLSLDENAALLAHLVGLGGDHDPGVTDDGVRVGVLLPPGGNDPDGQAAVLRKLLATYFEAINAQGGVYHRRLTPAFAEMPRTAASRVGTVRAVAMGPEPAFALIATDLGGGDPSIAAAAEDAGVPLVGLAAPPDAERPNPARFAFSLFAGPGDQALALARHALRGAAADATVAVAHGRSAPQAALARDVAIRLRTAGFHPVCDVEVPDPPGSLGAASAALRGAEAVVILGPPGRTASLLRAVAAGRGEVPLPEVLIPGALADRDLLDLPREFDGRVRLAFPIAPTDQSAAAVARLSSLATTAGVGVRHRPAQMAVLAAAEMLVEGLRRADRDLTRERFVAGLERLRDFRTGLAPPLTFGPNRRIGAPALTVILDLAGRRLAPAGPWAPADAP